MSSKTLNWAALSICAALIAIANPAYASGSTKTEKVEGPVYVDFKNIVVPVIKKNGRTGVVALSMMAEVKNAEAKTEVTHHLPKLRDAFIRALYGNLETKQYVREDGVLNIEQIKTRLMKTAAFVMKDKESTITDILFQNIAQQSY